MLEAAGRLIDRYADGVWLAELAPLGDAVADPVRGRARARRTRGPRRPGARDRHGVRRRQGAAAPARQRRAPRRRCRTVRRTAARERAGPAHPHDQPRGAGRPGRGGPPAAVPVLPRGRRLAGRAVSRSPSADVDGAAATEAVRLFTERATSADPAFTLARFQRRLGRRDLPAARRHPPGDRARGSARLGHVAGRHRAAAGRPVPPAGRGSPDGRPAPADAPRADRLELGPPDRRGPAPAPAPVGVQRGLDGPDGGPDRRRRRRRDGSRSISRTA